ncbi:MAG: hypothetical protein KTR16_15460 [Acidiferrobacterales bacterium]|nr:hypothetical protein [Acidiferrobacterales bacterium]
MGSSHLHINVNAKSIHEFVSPDSQFLREIVRNSYSRSRCYNLNSILDINVVLDILGEQAYGLKGDVSDDLLDIELLEEIAWHIGERYRHCLNIPKPPIKRANKRYRNNVIDFPSRKIRQANAKL